MKLVRYSVDHGIKYGVLKNNIIHTIAGTPFYKIKTLDEYYRLSEVKLLAPVIPSKILALGLNYSSHAKEFRLTVPKVPLFFIKPATAVIGPGENIILPPSSHRVDYEAELGVVIKKKARYISRIEAKDFILGYTCFNDVTARDQQKEDVQWTRAKSYDTFAPIGPYIETNIDPGNLIVESYLNGQLKQRGYTKDLIFQIPDLVSFISHVMTLLPGDVIATGTPSGVGPMKPGDTVDIRIDGIGILTNQVVERYE